MANITANAARATLESALRERKLDRTLTTAVPSIERMRTDVAALDACLRGGLPRGHVSEIAGPASSGRTTLLLALVGAATRRGEVAAIIDTFDRLDVASTVGAGIDRTRLLWVRGQAIAGSSAGVERALDRALKAFTLVLQAGGFGVVALDVADVPVPALRRLPFATWLRVQRMVEGSDTACVIVAPQPLARSAGGSTLVLSSSTTHTIQWAGVSSHSRRLAGLDVAVRVVSPRRQVDGEAVVHASVAHPGV
jgi:recombination protein RecA